MRKIPWGTYQSALLQVFGLMMSVFSDDTTLSLTSKSVFSVMMSYTGHGTISVGHIPRTGSTKYQTLLEEVVVDRLGFDDLYRTVEELL